MTANATPSHPWLSSILGLVLAAHTGAPARGVSPFALTTEQSVLAVVTHKAGPAARLAHNHLVVASDVPAELAFAPGEPEATRFVAEIRTDGLAVDDPALQELWYPRLAELGVLSEPFEQPSESDRRKIREAMLSDEQLDGAAHPTLGVRLVAVRAEASQIGEVAFSHVADVEWTIRGATVMRTVAARWSEEGGVVTLEAVGTLRFTDFGIEPYSAVFGAVRNADEFQVYARLVGRTN
jgi:hypothetical protein